MANRLAHFATNLGDFQVELFEGRAPATTKNFIDLVEKGYYDEIIFHRVIAGFMLQGGCPDGTGRGGPGYTIPDEFHTELTHDSEGVLSMANAGPNTGGSQFFVTLAATDWLDGKHAVFGKVVEGIETIRSIGTTATGPEDRPLDPVTTTVRENKNPGGAPQVFGTERIRNGLSHHVNPHVDIVVPHHLGQNKVELFKTNPIIPFP